MGLFFGVMIIIIGFAMIVFSISDLKDTSHYNLSNLPALFWVGIFLILSGIVAVFLSNSKE